MAVFGTRDIKFKQLLPIFKDAGRTTAQVFLLIAGSTVFSQAATIAQLPAAVTEAFGGMGQIQFLLMLNVLLLIVGCFFDTSAAILILAPMLLPTAAALGIPSLHLGMVFVVNLAIGLFTPPVGVNLYVACGIGDIKIEEITKGIIPCLLAELVVLLLITYIPSLSLMFVG